MTDRTPALLALLDQTPMGDAPLPDILREGRARKRRRRRVLAASGVLAIVLALSVGAAGVRTLSSDGPDDATSPAAPGPTTTPSANESSNPNTVPQLSGTWLLDALVAPNGHGMLPRWQRDVATLTFRHGQLTVLASCEGLDEPYAQGGATGQNLRFNGYEVLPGSVCTGGVEGSTIGQRFLDVRHVSMSGGILYLHTGNWMIIAALRPDGPDPSSTRSGRAATTSPMGSR